MFLCLYVFMQQPVFGKTPTGKQMEYIRQSPNYRDGKFQNLNHTPDINEEDTYLSVMKKFFFEKSKRVKPKHRIPSVKTDLKTLTKERNMLVWFGHSSYFMQLDGKRILVDPVLSGSASPVSFTTRSFLGTDIYSAEDMPDIDYLFITHDHYDHLDFKTMKKLKPKIGKVICGLGVKEHLNHWGIDCLIEEKDWNEELILDEGFTVNTTPGRHFSGRKFKRNQSLWMSFVLKTPTMKVFIGGDSGYDTHFKTIGDIYGPFDFAILECGQYNSSWKYIHMMPEETVQASIDLKSSNLLALHWGKFSLSIHDWDEPIKRAFICSREMDVRLLTPMIGEPVNLVGENSFENWWENIN